MVRYTEFQAIVLAGGKGSRMTELTAGKPKCLLPIGNKPMIWYPLRLLERVGFTDAIVVVTENMKNDVWSTLDKTGLSLRLELVAIPGGEDLGTADSLRFLGDKIQHDMIVLSCDLIADIDISELLDSYRNHNASICALMLPVPRIAKDFVTPGPKSKHKPETDLIGIDDKTDRLVFLASASDFEESIDLGRRLLEKYTNFTINSKLLDAHLYIINKWVMQFLVHNKNLSTLKGELLPYVVKKQLSRPPKQPYEEKNTSTVRLNVREDIFRFAIERPLAELVREMSAFNDRSTDLKEAYHGDPIRCYAYTVTGKFGLRANTVQMYALANRMLSELWSFNDTTEGQHAHSQIASTAVVKSTQVQNCRIDEGVFVDEKTSLRDSHIGQGTRINTKTRISESVIIGNATIGQRSVITNCILCDGCVIEEGSELKDCLVGAQHVVAAGSRHSREVLTESDRFMEI